MDLLCLKLQPPFLFSSGLLQMILNLCAALTNGKSAHAQTRTESILGNCNQRLFQQNILLTTLAFAYIHLWNTHTFRWGTRTRHTVLNQVELTGCRSVLPQRTSSMCMPCTSLFIPIGRCTLALSGLGSAYVLMSPCSQLCGQDKKIGTSIVHHSTNGQITRQYAWL